MTELALRITVVIFMAGSLGAVGLALSPRDAIEPLRQPGFVVRVLVASWLVPPALALLLLAVVPLEPAYVTGLWLLALAPCAPFAPALVSLAGGHAASMAAVMLTSIVTTVVVMPLALPLAAGVSADFLTIARPLLVLVLLPVAIGIMVRRVAPGAAQRLRRPLDIVTGVTGAIGLGLVGVVHGRGIDGAVGSLAIATQIVFLCAIAIVVHGIGWGLDERQRRTLTICSVTRNLGAALAPLAGAASDQRAIVMVAIAVPTTLAIGVLAAVWLAGEGQRRRVTPGG